MVRVFTTDLKREAKTKKRRTSARELRVEALDCVRVTKRSKIEVIVSKSSVKIKNTVYTPARISIF